MKKPSPFYYMFAILSVAAMVLICSVATGCSESTPAEPEPVVVEETTLCQVVNTDGDTVKISPNVPCFVEGIPGYFTSECKFIEEGLPSSSSMGPPEDLLNADTIPTKTGVPENLNNQEN